MNDWLRNREFVVHKFGGASIHNADAVRNACDIIAKIVQPAIIVASAMGKMTNLLEEVATKIGMNDLVAEEWSAVQNYHYKIVKDLFGKGNNPVRLNIEAKIAEFRKAADGVRTETPDFIYDQIVPLGEILATIILSEALKARKINNHWIDIRKSIRTNDRYGSADVDWKFSGKQLLGALKSVRSHSKVRLFITQGFIGSTKDGYMTTLGREGSDFTAAILAKIVNARSVTVWKDVPGIMNADPKWFKDTVKIPLMSYHDSIELAYYGATVIHPKTIKPLQNQEIPLSVRSFKNPELDGTIISSNEPKQKEASFIFKMDQVLISFFPRDFSFIDESKLSEIIGGFAKLDLKINLMQNSALSFTVSVDSNPSKIKEMIYGLKMNYKILYNSGLELVTIRYYDEKTIARVCLNKRILVEHRSRHTIQLVMKDRK